MSEHLATWMVSGYRTVTVLVHFKGCAFFELGFGWFFFVSLIIRRFFWRNLFEVDGTFDCKPKVGPPLQAGPTVGLWDGRPLAFCWNSEPGRCLQYYLLEGSCI